MLNKFHRATAVEQEDIWSSVLHITITCLKTAKCFVLYFSLNS